MLKDLPCKLLCKFNKFHTIGSFSMIVVKTQYLTLRPHLLSVACGWNSREIRAPEVKEVRRGEVRQLGRGHHVVYPDHTYSKCDKKPLEPRMTWADFPLKSNTLASLWRTDSKGAKVGERKTSWMDVEELRQKSWRR